MLVLRGVYNFNDRFRGAFFFKANEYFALSIGAPGYNDKIETITLTNFMHFITSFNSHWLLLACEFLS